ncbi:hypothetical protein TCAL_16134, partial [Tigriopus californicus]
PLIYPINATTYASEENLDVVPFATCLTLPDSIAGAIESSQVAFGLR